MCSLWVITRASKAHHSHFVAQVQRDGMRGHRHRGRKSQVTGRATNRDNKGQTPPLAPPACRSASPLPPPLTHSLTHPPTVIIISHFTLHSQVSHSQRTAHRHSLSQSLSHCESVTQCESVTVSGSAAQPAWQPAAEFNFRRRRSSEKVGQSRTNERTNKRTNERTFVFRSLSSVCPCVCVSVWSCPPRVRVTFY